MRNIFSLLALTCLFAQVAWAIEEPTPIPLTHELPAARVTLGNRLFHDPRLSSNNSFACGSCHALRLGGADRTSTAVGIGRGTRNTPTVYNTGFLSVYFWDARAHSLEEQMDGPIHNPIEMGSNWPEILEKLSVDRTYQAGFEKTYSTGMTELTIKDAIATFERSLITPNARFDRYLRGDAQAITANEREGYARFREVGCMNCHDGPLFGGKQMVDGLRTPPLRNVEFTPPYFSTGQIKTLPTAVDVMISRYAAHAAKPGDVANIVAFLKTLTGDYKGRPINDWTHPRSLNPKEFP